MSAARHLDPNRVKPTFARRSALALLAASMSFAVAVPAQATVSTVTSPTAAVNATAVPSTARTATTTTVVPKAKSSKVTRYVKTSRANVRSGTSTRYKKVKSLRRGTKVTGTKMSNGWIRISSRQYISPLTLTTRKPSSSASRSSSRSSLPTSSAVLREAKRNTGIMYRWGGTTRAGFDCSGYTQYVYKQLGVKLPRTVAAQRAATTRVSSPRPGDLVFWGTWHNAIYAGNGYIYDSGKPGIRTQKRKMFSGVTSYGRIK